MQVEQTSIANEITKALSEKHSFLWDNGFSLDTIKMMAAGMAMYLGNVKDKKVVKACRIDSGNKFHIGGYVKFEPSEEDETKGEFKLVFTFEAKDIPEGAEIADIQDPVFRHIMADEGYRRCRIRFNAMDGQDYLLPALTESADAIKEYLRANANIDPELELKDYFTATVEIDGDKNYYAITPSAQLKQYIKDDAAHESESVA